MQEYLMSLFKALRMVLTCSACYIVFINVFYAYYIIVGKKNGKVLSELVGAFFSKPKGVILCEITFVLGIILSPPIYRSFENTDIGSFFEKETYNESYYVYLRKDNNKAKAYKLKADIFKGNYGHSSYADDGEEIFVIDGNGYFLEKVYWSNGGYLTFLGREEYPDTSLPARLYVGQETRVTDYHDNNYYVTLTTEKVN